MLGELGIGDDGAWIDGPAQLRQEYIESHYNPGD